MNEMRKLMEAVADLEEGSGDVRGEFLSLVQSIQRSDDGDAIDNLIVDLVDALTDEQTAELLALWGEDEGYGEEGLEEDSSDEGAVMVGGKAVDMQSLSFAGVDFRDYPDFCDAWIEEALFVDGSQLSQDQIDELGEKYTDEVYERLMSKIF